MVLLIRNTVVIFTLSIGAYAWGSSSPGHNSFCYDENLSGKTLSSSSLTEFLDCSASATDLSLVDAQWIILNKAHWSFRDSQRLDTFEYDLAIKGIDNGLNTMNPLDKHQLEINFNKYTNTKEGLRSLVSWLEKDVFPAILNGEGSPHPHQNRTSWSIDSSFHHYLAYHDTPLPKSNRFRKEGSKALYRGTLLESARWKGDWYQKYFEGLKDRNGRQQSTAFTVLETSFLGTRFWPELRAQYGRLGEHTSTRCLFYQERKATQALFTLLDHPALVEAVHFRALPGFGPSQEDYQYYVDVRPKQEPYIQEWIDDFLQADIWGKGERLPQTVGGIGFPILAVITGDLDLDYSLTGCQGYSNEECASRDENDEPNFANSINYAAFGPHGLIGRPLYIEAINKSIRNRNGSAAYYQGQNAIVREISQAAADSLLAMRGLGDKRSEKISLYDGYMVHPENRPPVRGDVDQATMVRDPAQVRLVIERANELVDELFPYGSASYWLADYSRQAYLKNPTRNHAVNTNPYFTQTTVSFGLTLKQWADFLKRKQPGMRYYMTAYDYGMRQRQSKRPNFKSYYDRLLEILDPEKGRNMFKEFEI